MQKADIILKSNCIFDAVENKPFAGYIAIQANKIVAVEKTSAATGSMPEAAKVIDLGNQTVCPGFLDNHVFFTGYVWGERGNDTEGAESQSPQMKKMFLEPEVMEEEYIHTPLTLRIVTSTTTPITINTMPLQAAIAEDLSALPPLISSIQEVNSL